jgi:hypothetical protein
MHTQPLLIPLFVVLTAASAAATPTTHPARITLVQNEEARGAGEPPTITDDQEKADQAYRENALKLEGIIRRHQKELKLPGVVAIQPVAADAYHEWLRVMVKELTPQLDRQFPSELEGVWIQVVDQTRYDEKCAAAKQVVDSNAHRLMKQPGIESIGVGGDPYDAMDIWIVIGVDKITPPVEQETPAEMGGFPVHLLETGGPAHFL